MSAVPIKNGKGAIILHTNLTDLVRTQRELERALSEVAQLTDRLQAESEYLREEIKSRHDFEEIVGNSEAIRKTLRRVELVARTSSTVLLLGETGTGKELLARNIHARSERQSRPLIKVDCGTLPSGLIESELFGHERGAFTGAYESKAGRFELAHEGTIFLDEIGELPLDLQSKLLRVLEDGELRRLGARQEKEVNVRVIAATNRDLRQAIRKGEFREDLYYRISVFPIEIPPLRRRPEDISPLVSYFVTQCAREACKTIRSISKASMSALEAYDWPGNVRELRNVIERSVILCQDEILEVAESLGDFEVDTAQSKGQLAEDVEAVERTRILRALEESGWKVKGDGNAASRLGLSPSTLRSKMKKLGITRP
jgi:transcriptional regulator with GAF, ATPase, and Fis domain